MAREYDPERDGGKTGWVWPTAREWWRDVSPKNNCPPRSPKGCASYHRNPYPDPGEYLDEWWSKKGQRLRLVDTHRGLNWDFPVSIEKSHRFLGIADVKTIPAVKGRVEVPCSVPPDESCYSGPWHYTCEDDDCDGQIDPGGGRWESELVVILGADNGLRIEEPKIKLFAEKFLSRARASGFPCAESKWDSTGRVSADELALCRNGYCEHWDFCVSLDPKGPPYPHHCKLGAIFVAAKRRAR